MGAQQIGQAIRAARGGLHRNVLVPPGTPMSRGIEYADIMIGKLFGLRMGGRSEDRLTMGGTLPEAVEWVARNTPKLQRVPDEELRALARGVKPTNPPTSVKALLASKDFRRLVLSEDNPIADEVRRRAGVGPLMRKTGGAPPETAVEELRNHLTTKVHRELAKYGWYEDFPDARAQLEQVQRVVLKVVGTDPLFKKYVRTALPSSSQRKTAEAIVDRPVGAPLVHVGNLLSWYAKKTKEYKEAVKKLGEAAASPLKPPQFSEVVEKSLERGRKTGLSPLGLKRRDSYEKLVRSLAMQAHYAKSTQSPADIVRKYQEAGLLKTREDVVAAQAWARKQKKFAQVGSMPVHGMEEILDDLPWEGQLAKTGGWVPVAGRRLPSTDPHAIIAAHSGKARTEMPPEIAWAEAARRRRAFRGDQVWDPSVSEWMYFDDVDFPFQSEGSGDWRETTEGLTRWAQDRFSPGARDPWGEIMGGGGPTKPGAMRPLQLRLSGRYSPWSVRDALKRLGGGL